MCLELLPIPFIVYNSSEFEPGKVFRPIQMTPKVHEHYLVGEKYSQSLSFPKAREYKDHFKSPRCSAWSWSESTSHEAFIRRGSRRSSYRPCPSWLLSLPRQAGLPHPVMLLLKQQILNLDSGTSPCSIPVHLWRLDQRVWVVGFRAAAESHCRWPRGRMLQSGFYKRENKVLGERGDKY